MVICGATSGPDPDIDIRSAYQHHRQILGAPMGNRQDFRDTVTLATREQIEPVIDRVLPLADLAEGHRANGKPGRVRQNHHQARRVGGPSTETSGRVKLSMIPPDGGGLQPPFSRRRLRMTECI